MLLTVCLVVEPMWSLTFLAVDQVLTYRYFSSNQLQMGFTLFLLIPTAYIFLPSNQGVENTPKTLDVLVKENGIGKTILRKIGLKKFSLLMWNVTGGENSARVYIEKHRELYKIQLTLFLSKGSKLMDLR